MVLTESVTLRVPAGMAKYLTSAENTENELTRNALLLYPYILNQTISHGGAAEILGISKTELIDLYDRLGYSYFDMTMDDLELELENFRKVKPVYFSEGYKESRIGQHSKKGSRP